METTEVMERLHKIIVDPERMSLRIEEELNLSTSFLDDLALDSIQILELLVGIEHEFSIVVDTDAIELDMFNRVADVVAFIQSQVAAKAVAV